MITFSREILIKLEFGFWTKCDLTKKFGVLLILKFKVYLVLLYYSKKLAFGTQFGHPVFEIWFSGFDHSNFMHLDIQIFETWIRESRKKVFESLKSRFSVVSNMIFESLKLYIDQFTKGSKQFFFKFQEEYFRQNGNSGYLNSEMWVTEL